MNLLGLFIISIFIALFFAHYILFNDSKKYTFLNEYIKDKPPLVIFDKIDIRSYRPDTVFSPKYSCSIFCYEDFIIICDFSQEKIPPQVWYFDTCPKSLKSKLINRVKMRDIEVLNKNSISMRGRAIIINLPFHFYMNSYKSKMFFKSEDMAQRFLDLYSK